MTPSITRPYGNQLILDMSACNSDTFNRDAIDRFMIEVCDEIGVNREDCHFWDDVDVPEEEQQTDPRTTGTSVCQFILTSSIVVHLLDLLKEVYIDLFSCDTFIAGAVEALAIKHFGGRVVASRLIQRGT